MFIFLLGLKWKHESGMGITYILEVSVIWRICVLYCSTYLNVVSECMMYLEEGEDVLRTQENGDWICVQGHDCEGDWDPGEPLCNHIECQVPWSHEDVRSKVPNVFIILNRAYVKRKVSNSTYFSYKVHIAYCIMLSYEMSACIPMLFKSRSRIKVETT
jgi:hypothetical protein